VIFESVVVGYQFVNREVTIRDIIKKEKDSEYRILFVSSTKMTNYIPFLSKSVC